MSEQPAAPATLADVTAALDKTVSTSARFVETQAMSVGDVGNIDWISTTDYDSSTGSFRAITGFSASPPELVDMMTGNSGLSAEDLTTEVLRVGGTTYLTMKAWPPELRGRRLAVTAEQTAAALASQGMQLGADASAPSRLLTLIDSAGPTVTRSGSRYTLPALGAQAVRFFAREEIDAEQLTGDVPFDVMIDDEGRIGSTQLDATPAAWRPPSFCDCRTSASPCPSKRPQQTS